MKNAAKMLLNYLLVLSIGLSPTVSVSADPEKPSENQTLSEFLSNFFSSKNTSMQNTSVIMGVHNNKSTPAGGAPAAQVISPADLNALIAKKSKNPEESNNQKPVELRVRGENSNVASLADTKVTDIKQTYLGADPKNPKKRVYKMSVQTASNDTVEFLLEVDPTKPSVQEFAPTKLKNLLNNFRTSTVDSVKTFPFEIAPFYLGIMANNYLNLLIRKDKDPFAMDRFWAETTDPVGNMSFIAFMIGNRFAQNFLNQSLGNTNYFKKMIPFLSMGVGSIFSSLSHDVIALTKPCADALWDKENNSDEQIAAKCQEGWDAVMTSDKLHEYVKSTTSVMLASWMSHVAQAFIAKGGTAARSALPTLNSLAVKFENRIIPMIKPSEKNIWGRTKTIGGAASPWLTKGVSMLSPYSVGLTAFNLILFFQADALANPTIHYQYEKLLNSGERLAQTKVALNETLSHIKNSSDAWNTNYCPDLSETIKSYGARDVPLYKINNITNQCTGAASMIKSVQNYSEKWRQALLHEFMMGYYSWSGFLSEFQVTYQVAREFDARLAKYASSKNDSLKPNPSVFNPIFQDDPFYGVIPDGVKDVVPYVHPNEYESKFPGYDYQKLVKARIARVLKSKEVIVAQIANLEKYKNTIFMSSYVNELIRRLKNILANFNSYKEGSSDYSPLVAGLKGVVDAYAYVEKSVPKTPGKGDSGEDIWAREAVPAAIKSVSAFIGRPMPLTRGDSFMIRFNDDMKKLYPDYIKILSKKKGNVADSALWSAVCGADLNGIKGRIIDPLDVSTNLQKTRKKGFLEFFDFGTAWNFSAPKIVSVNTKEICSKDFALRPSDKKQTPFIYNVDINTNTKKAADVPNPYVTKKHSNLLDFAADNLSPEILSDGSANLEKWWAEVVEPRILNTYNEFEAEYVQLVKKYLVPSLESGDYSKNPNFNQLLLNNKLPRHLNGLPKGFAQSYVDDLNLYLGIINGIHRSTFTNAKLSSKEKEIALGEINDMARITDELKKSVLNMLTQYRSFTYQSVVDPRANATPSTMDVTYDYANILFIYKLLADAMGVIDPNGQVDLMSEIRTRADLAKFGYEDPVHGVGILSARLENDKAVSEHFEKISNERQNMFMRPIPLDLQKGLLSDQNAVAKILLSNPLLSPFTKNLLSDKPKDLEKARIIYASLTNLMGLLEEIYATSALIKAASGPLNDYEELKIDKTQKQGVGSSGL